MNPKKPRIKLRSRMSKEDQQVLAFGDLCAAVVRHFQLPALAARPGVTREEVVAEYKAVRSALRPPSGALPGEGEPLPWVDEP